LEEIDFVMSGAEAVVENGGVINKVTNIFDYR
jgi:translation initiation factor 2B subunit (eIF-2B alpha/beta/delta family)